MNKQQKSIKNVFTNRLTLFVIIPILVVSIIIIVYFTFALNKAVDQKYQILITMFYQKIETFLTEIQDDLLFNAQIINMKHQDNRFLNDYFKNLLTNKSYIKLVQILDNDGVVQYAFPHDEQMLYNDYSEYPFFKEALKKKDIYWSASFIPRHLSVPINILSALLDDGLLTIYIDMADISQYLNIIELPESCTYKIIDQTGRIIANSTTLKTGANEYETNYAMIINKIENQKSAIDSVLQFRHSNIKYDVKSIKETGWIIVLIQPAIQIKLEMIIDIIILTLIILIILFIQRQFTQKQIKPILISLNTIIKNIGKMKRGSYDLQIKNQEYQELNILAYLFNRMAKSVKKREKEIIENREKWKKIFKSSPDPIIITDLKSIITDCNPACLKTLGYGSKIEMINTRITDLMDESDIPFTEIIFTKILKNRLVENIYFKLMTYAKQYIDTEISAAALTGPDNEPALILYLIKDITKRKQSEKEKERMIEELEEKQKELERFVYTVSHDLRSPLITIKGFTGLLEEDLNRNDREQISDYISRILTAVMRMDNLLNDLLELSRVGRVQEEKGYIQVDTVIAQVIEDVDGRIKEKQVVIEVTPGMPAVYANRNRLAEVFQNLIENSLKYTGIRQSLIQVGFNQGSGVPVFYVKDNGMGIHPENQKKIFDLFRQLNPGSEGTGMGLALVQRILKSYGGRIWVESDGENMGTTFYFTFSS